MKGIPPYKLYAIALASITCGGEGGAIPPSTDDQLQRSRSSVCEPMRTWMDIEAAVALVDAGQQPTMVVFGCAPWDVYSGLYRLKLERWLQAPLAKPVETMVVFTDLSVQPLPEGTAVFSEGVERSSFLNVCRVASSGVDCTTTFPVGDLRSDINEAREL